VVAPGRQGTHVQHPLLGNGRVVRLVGVLGRPRGPSACGPAQLRGLCRRQRPGQAGCGRSPSGRAARTEWRWTARCRGWCCPTDQPPGHRFSSCARPPVTILSPPTATTEVVQVMPGGPEGTGKCEDVNNARIPCPRKAGPARPSSRGRRVLSGAYGRDGVIGCGSEQSGRSQGVVVVVVGGLVWLRHRQPRLVDAELGSCPWRWGTPAPAASGLRSGDMAVGAVLAGWRCRPKGVVLRETGERGPQNDDGQIRGGTRPASRDQSGPGAPQGPDVMACVVRGDPGPAHLNRSRPPTPEPAAAKDWVAGPAGPEHG
jgi:hypothetical protein